MTCYFQQCGMCDQQSLRSACAYAQSDQSLCWSLEYSVTVKLLSQHHLEFLSLKGGCTGSSESTLVKMPQCWKSHVTAHFSFLFSFSVFLSQTFSLSLSSCPLPPLHICTCLPLIAKLTVEIYTLLSPCNHDSSRQHI